MKNHKILLISLLISSVVSSKQTYSQDLLNQYSFIQPNIYPANLTKNLNTSANVGAIVWVNPQNNPFTSYNGEYEILMRSDWLFWHNYTQQGAGFGLAVSYNIEVVSFPFIPDCIKEAQGCGSNNPNLNRNLLMPNDPYDNSTKSWDYVKRIIPNTKFGVKGSSLASFVYAIDNPLFTTNRNYFPHTILKHTVSIHCEVNSAGNPTTPPIFKFSWLHDNTRGRMKYYPFCPNGYANCGESQYDVCFNPRILHRSPTHAYNETQTNAILPGAGTINYFDYNDIINSNCNLSSIITLYPLPNWMFYNGGYIRAYLPPYTLVTAPLYQSEGRVIAGYESDPNITNQFNAMYGVKQNYTINSNIDIVNTEISQSDRIFYNPSDVTITAPNLYFPSHYSFRTIRGVYPTPAEVLADNTAINGGPFIDPRVVPVRTDLRCEDVANFPHDASIPDDAKYASLYRLAAGSKLTLEPCVSVFDAAFILNPGSTLELSNKTSIIGLHRVAIDRYGGRLIEKYELNSGILYLQKKTETALAPNTYYVNSKIFAGENVDVSSLVGPYIASTGTNLELIASDYIKLDHGFHAEAGAEVKIQIDPLMQIPPCPPPASGGSGNRFANLSANSIVDATAHIKLLPTLFTNSTGIYSENKNEDPIVSVEVLDASGKKIKQINEINDYFIEVDLASMNDGMYFFIIQTNNNRKVLKGVKQN
ncbi:MAG: T9SS type A sorting domain-containing protein [Bacteroidetes bacterium]|nr:T9SS type A sorting domain-containing protein [Bacteroidota bacterium]